MLAPVDARVVVKVGGEDIALRLNFRSIAQAEKHGIDLLSESAPELNKTDGLVLVKCLALEEQPYFEEGHVLAMVAQNNAGVQKALVDLFAQFGGAAKPGNATRRKAKSST